MRSPIRALLVAVVTMLAMALVFPSVALAKSSRQTRSHTKTTTTTTKRVVKRPWKKGHAKANAKPQRTRKSPAPKHHPKKG